MNKCKPNRFFIFAAAFFPLSLLADVQPAALFTDHMVIQRNTQAPVWGTGDAGEAVTVEGSWGKSAKTTVDETGQWRVDLKTPQAGGPHTLTIQGKNTIQIQDVLSGEVWFCSGQSNMDFVLNQLRRSFNGRTEQGNIKEAEFIAQEIDTASDSMLRQFTVTKNTSPFEKLNTLAGNWKPSSPAENGNFSATAYFFGKELRHTLQVPVGLIKCAWGGTRVEAWMPAETFHHNPEMKAYLEKETAGLKAKVADWNPEAVQAKYQAALQKWELERKGRRPKPAGNPAHGAHNPTTLFNGMVNPVIPYAIKGAIWYQGESNTKHNTEQYEDNFKAMITGWRALWGQGDFPFYYTQLASFRMPQEHPVEHDDWASVQEHQRRALSLENTGMAVLNDIGEAKDVHPHNKMDAGRRLALWAFKQDYNQKVPAWSGPLYKGHTIRNGKILIEFDHAGSGLMTGTKAPLEETVETDAPLKRFQICGADRQWKWAQAEITGKHTVTVSHPDIPNPTVARYAWAANPKGANLYNKEGLPASLFTTEAAIPAVPAPAPKVRTPRQVKKAPKAAAAAAEPSTARAKKKKRAPGPAPTFSEVAYDVHARTKLDFWQAEGEGPRPVHVFIHGGGWIQGDKSQFREAAASLEKGISVAAVNYRLTGTDPLPAPVHDAVRAIQFLRSKAKEWNIDKERFVLTGGSAGGCSSVWIACHDDLADPDSDDPVERESSRVQGAAVRGAQTSIDPRQIEPWIGPNVYHPMIYMAVGEETVEAAKENYAKHAATYQEFSAYNHLTADDPPLFLGYGADLTVPAKSIGHGIHHGMFGVKLKERSEEVGHNQVHLDIRGKHQSTEYSSQDAFIDGILLGE